MALGFCKSIGIKPLWLEYTFYQIKLEQIKGLANEI